MMDQPLFMTPRMLDIASRGRYHEVDTTFLKDKDYKYVLHIVPYDEAPESGTPCSVCLRTSWMPHSIIMLLPDGWS